MLPSNWGILFRQSFCNSAPSWWQVIRRRASMAIVRCHLADMSRVRCCMLAWLLVAAFVASSPTERKRDHRSNDQEYDDFEEDQDTIDDDSGCSVDGVRYSAGEVIPTEGHCTECTCHDGKKLCHTKTCFKHVCPRSYVPEGQCCRQCACKDDKDIEHEVGTSFAGQANAGAAGEMCMECQCKRDINGNAVAHCYRPMCPVIETNCIETEVKEGKCCPSCKSYGQLTKSCSFDGVPKRDGSTWKLGSCFMCACSNGGVSCSKNCPKLTCKSRTLPGKCCPICIDGSGGGRTFPPVQSFFPQPTTSAPRTFPPFPAFGDASRDDDDQSDDDEDDAQYEIDDE